MLEVEMKPKPEKRVLPPVYRAVLSVDWHRKFRLSERLKILFGYNFNVLIRIKTMHKPGQHLALVVGETSKYTNPNELLASQIKEQLDKEMSPL